MEKVLLYGFSKSERFMFADCFKRLFPQRVFEAYRECEAAAEEECGAAIINYRYAGSRGLALAGRFAARGKVSVLFSLQRCDGLLFLQAAEAARNAPGLWLMLFCPEDSSELAGCAEGAAGKRRGFMSRDALRTERYFRTNEPFDLEALTDLDREIIFAELEGMGSKHTAAVSGKEPHYIDSRTNVLRARYPLLRVPNMLSGLLSWLSRR
jgi:hypothetical protein